MHRTRCLSFVAALPSFYLGRHFALDICKSFWQLSLCDRHNIHTHKHTIHSETHNESHLNRGVPVRHSSPSNRKRMHFWNKISLQSNGNGSSLSSSSVGQSVGRSLPLRTLMCGDTSGSGTMASAVAQQQACVLSISRTL